LAMATMSSFLAGLGRTKAVMWVSLIGAAFNIPMNYLLIYGLRVGGEVLIPDMGVRGAAIATVLSWILSAAIYAFLIFNRRMEASHKVRSVRQLEWPLMGRLLKYGWPGGLQFFMEVFAFGFFNFAVSKLDQLTLACNNIVFSIEALSFFPMIGVGQTVSIMVGQAIGRWRPKEGARATVSGMVISSSYVFCMLLVFLLLPEEMLSLFIAEDLDSATQAFILGLGTILLRYVALYSVFDGIYLCCFGAIKGSGDVWFPMWAMAFWGIFGLIAPISALFLFGAATIEAMWLCMVLYILLLTGTGYWRYKGGKWMGMRVIEPALDLE
ncbi:MAG: MATE family efflux transporter, partial [Deltaproteobacteria bacterium]|nr:MATE family efflux transporter [Deltaproteobacteria bacterium]